MRIRKPTRATASRTGSAARCKGGKKSVAANNKCKVASAVAEKPRQVDQEPLGADLSSLPERLRTLGPEFYEVTLRLKAAIASDDGRYRVVAAGMMNPGKSTLLNALLGKADFFKVADVRETTVVRSVPWGKKIVLIDTPGFSSAVGEDDDEALSAIRQADLVLFVHNLAIGGINRAELDVLMSIEEMLGVTDFRKRVLFVNTRSDECPDEDRDRNEDECKALVEENMGCKLKSYVVSSRQHLQGLEMVKAGNDADGKVLVDAAGIKALVRGIRSCAKKEGARSKEALSRIVSELQVRVSELTQRRESIQQTINTGSQSLHDSWSKVLAEIRPFWEECRK